MKKESTVKGFAILSAAAMTVKVLSFLYIPVLIALIHDEGWGVYSSSYNIFVFFYAVTNAGIPSAISKMVSEFIAQGNYKDAVKTFKLARTALMAIGLVMAIALFFSAEYIAYVTKSPRSVLAIKFLSPTVFFSSMTSAYRGYFQGRGNMLPTAVSQVFEQIVNILFTLTLVAIYKNSGLEKACAGGTFATSIASFCAVLFLSRVYKKRKEWKIVKFHVQGVKRFTNKQIIRRVLDYGIPITICVVLQNLGNLIDMGNIKSRLLVAGCVSKRADELFGYYTKYNQLLGVPNSIITSLSVAILPAIAASMALKNKKEVGEKVNMAFRISFMVSIPAAVGLSVLGKPFFNMARVGGGDFLITYGAFVLVFMSCIQTFNAILQGIGKLYVVVFFLLIGITGKIASNYFLIAIPEINIMGAIIGNCIYYGVPLVLDCIVLSKFLKVKLDIFSNAVKPLISAVVMGGVVFLLKEIVSFVVLILFNQYIADAISMIICTGAGVYVYLYVLTMIKGLTEEDLKILPAKMRKMLPGSIKKRMAN